MAHFSSFPSFFSYLMSLRCKCSDNFPIQGKLVMRKVKHDFLKLYPETKTFNMNGPMSSFVVHGLIYSCPNFQIILTKSNIIIVTISVTDLSCYTFLSGLSAFSCNLGVLSIRRKFYDRNILQITRGATVLLN